MKEYSIFSVIAILIALSISCQTTRYQEPNGFLFKSVKLNKDVSTGTDLGTKSGESCVNTFLPIVTIGDGSILAAAKAGGIKVIKGVDYSSTTFLFIDGYNLGIYKSLCTIARGE